MFLSHKHFHKPSIEARILSILNSLAESDTLSQSEIGQRSGLSSAMVNQYLKELQSREFVRFERINGKSFRYVLTTAGEQERQTLFSAYSAETIQIYSALKQVIHEKLRRLRDQKVRKLVLFGASETCEVVLSAMRDDPFEIVALLDNDPEKQGRMFHGYVVSPPALLDNITCDAVLITSFGEREVIRKQLEPVSRQKQIRVVGL